MIFSLILSIVALNLSGPVSGTSIYSNISEISDIEKYHNESSLQSQFSLEEERDMQENTFHWYPYQRIMYVVNNGVIERFCKPPGSSIDEFPQFLTRNIGWIKLLIRKFNISPITANQRIHGLIAIHFFVALYLFIVIAFICDKYFLPSVERICQVLKISPVSLRIKFYHNIWRRLSEMLFLKDDWQKFIEEF